MELEDSPKCCMDVEDMISAFLRVAPNGALQSQKVKGALLKISQSCKINRSRFCDTDWSE